MQLENIKEGFIFTYQGIKHKIIKVIPKKRQVIILTLEGAFKNDTQTITFNGLLSSVNRETKKEGTL